MSDRKIVYYTAPDGKVTELDVFAVDAAEMLKFPDEYSEDDPRKRMPNLLKKGVQFLDDHKPTAEEIAQRKADEEADAAQAKAESDARKADELAAAKERIAAAAQTKKDADTGSKT